MTSAPYHLDHLDHQAIRETLYDLNILDTPLEERFQRITRMVCSALGVPISAFSIIDGERQWFKSIQGLDATENTREESFCAYTILGDDVMVVNDARKDVRFSTNPLVEGDPNIIFYAGCPIRAPNGRNIGSLCAIDTKVRELSPTQKHVLKDLAIMLESELKAAHMSKAQYDLIHDLNATQRLLLIDPSTRLWNRAGLEDIAKREWLKLFEQNVPISMIMLEIDNLSDITKKSGRAVSEAIIRDMGKRLLVTLNPSYTLGRLDGDRFLIIAPNLNLEFRPSDIDKVCADTTSKSFVIHDQPYNAILKYSSLPRTTDPHLGFDHILNYLDKELRA